MKNLTTVVKGLILAGTFSVLWMMLVPLTPFWKWLIPVVGGLIYLYMRRDKSVKKNSGVTLLEMIVVMGIMVVIVAMSIPSFLNFQNESRLRGASQNIMMSLKSARRYAITTRKPTEITLSFSEDTYDFYETQDSKVTRGLHRTINLTDELGNDSADMVLRFTPRGTVINQSDPSDTEIKFMLKQDRKGGASERMFTLWSATGNITIK